MCVAVCVAGIELFTELSVSVIQRLHGCDTGSGREVCSRLAVWGVTTTVSCGFGEFAAWGTV